MEITQGYSYHIKDSFFDLIQDDTLMKNKENNHYRPHFYAVKFENDNFLWMIPISSRVDKYRTIVDAKIKKHKKCNTIVIGRFAGNDNAFLIQNAFPITEKYLDHIHTVENKPITIHKDLNKTIVTYLKEVLAMRKRGINLIFSDIEKIKKILDSN